MKFSDVRSQLTEVYSRLIQSGISVKQNYPSYGEDESTIGDLKSTAIAMKNVGYSLVYAELDSHDQYHIRLPDGGLLLFQYNFDEHGIIKKHRLCFFPSPILPTVEEAPDLYENENLYGDIILERIVRFPVRFDYDPINYQEKYHPHSHVTFGQFDNCRIPVTSPVAPNSFVLFILRNFYFRLFRRHQNILERRMHSCETGRCITDAEIGFPHLVI